MKRALSLVLAILALTACSGGTTTSPSATAPASTNAPSPVGKLSSVDDLQAAYVRAGGTCGDPLDHRGIMTAAADSAWCGGGGGVLSIYIDHDDMKAAADRLIGFQELDRTLIMGDNWMINVVDEDRPTAAAIAKRMGGQLLEIKAKS